MYLFIRNEAAARKVRITLDEGYLLRANTLPCIVGGITY